MPTIPAMRFLISLILTASLVLGPSERAAVGAASATAPVQHITVLDAIRFDRLPALRDLPSAVGMTDVQPQTIPLGQLAKQGGAQALAQQRQPLALDGALQNAQVLGSMPAPSIQFEGISNTYNVAPPDPDGDIGLKHYVQWVNLGLKIWQIDRAAGTATVVYGPVNGNTLWKGFGGPCEATNNGDPVVLYDELADRWFLSQFSVEGVYYQCIAVSATSDPTGAWYRYAYNWGSKMNDYPKFGVWPDAYYMTTNQFIGDTWEGAGVAAFERSRMLLGLPARMIQIDLMPVNSNFGGMLPADLDGGQPPAGAPGYFAEVDDTSSKLGAVDEMRIWEFKVDWTAPEKSTFGQPANFGQPTQVLPVTDFNPLCLTTQDCLPQKGTTRKLDGIGDRLMFRLAYRYFAGDSPYESMVVNQTVNVGTDQNPRAAIRWYEIRRVNSVYSIAQQGTFAGADPSTDTLSRWMGSMAQDWQGNMALGYSLTSADSYPSIGYAGRLKNDPDGTLPQAEQVFFNGGYAQTSVNRWGDYTSMSVDPVDGCTFWYTNEYSLGGWNWSTRVAAFKMPACTPQPQGQITGVVKNQSGDLVQGAHITAGSYTQVTGADGRYTFPSLPPGTYTVIADKSGYRSQSAANLVVTAGPAITQDFTLVTYDPALVRVSVFDGSGQPDMPLRAAITVSSALVPDQVYYTDATTGQVNLDLIQSTSYTLTVRADGYYSQSRNVVYTTSPAQETFGLKVYPLNGCPAGYQAVAILNEGFEDGLVPPKDWTGFHLGDANPGFEISGVAATGLHSAYHNDTNVTNGMDDYLVTPALAIPSDAFLAFSEYGIYTGYYTFHGLLVTTGTDPDPKVSTYQQISQLPPPPEKKWQNRLFDLSGYSGQNVHLAYEYKGDFSDEWYLDDIKVFQCQAVPGARVMGYVKDANTGLPIIGAKVASAIGVTSTIATPDDPALGDGYYQTVVPLDNPVLTVSASRYKTTQETITVDPHALNQHDFTLPAGLLSPGAPEVSASLEIDGAPAGQTLTLNNTGGSALAFSIQEVNSAAPPFVPTMPTGPFAPAHRQVGAKNLDKPGLGGFTSYMEPAPAPMSPDRQATSWDSGLTYAWGIGYNSYANDLWIGDIALKGGDNKDHRFVPEGGKTGDAIDTGPWASAFAADMAYNPNTGKLWQVNVGGDNCIYELDPVTKAATGSKTCPSFSVSQRGLAYDPLTDTFYSGSWDDGVINHFNASGTLLDSKDLRLNIAGLAFNPATRHLFVLTNAVSDTDVFVLAVDQQYAEVDSFNVSGVDGSKQGLDMDCQGRLWVVSTPKIFFTEPIETGACAYRDIPWLSVSPATGSVSANGSQAVTLTFDPTDAVAGTKTAYLVLNDDTPYGMKTVKVTATFSGYGARLTTELAQQLVKVGGIASYSLAVTNVGSVADSYTVSVSGSAWNTVLSPTSVGPIEPGQTKQVVVTVQAPQGSSGKMDTATVKIVSKGRPSLVKTVTLQTLVIPALYLPEIHR